MFVMDEENNENQNAVDHPIAFLVTHLAKEIIWGHDNKRGRTAQKAVGPSGLGSACNLQLAYSARQHEKVNHSKDGWQAIVGTAIHAWLAEAVEDYEGGTDRFLIEQKVEVITPGGKTIRGTTDLYDRKLGIVADWKSTGSESESKVRKYGVPPGHIVQRNVYGMGLANMGEDPKWCANIYLPRDGNLDALYTAVAPYDAKIARAALARWDTIADAEDTPLEEFPRVPTNLCSWCDFYMPNAPDLSAGCRGKNQT